LIPDELVQSTELDKATQKAGYDLDRSSNLKGMSRKPGDHLDEFDLEHRGSHPRYTDAVKRELNDTTDRLKERYNTDG